MSIERYRSIVLSFSVQLSKRKVKYVIALTWLGAVLIGSPTIVEYHVYTAHSGNESYLACGSEGVTREFSILNALMLLFICYVIPLIVICVNYGRIILFILKRTARRDVLGINQDIQVPGPSQANKPSSSTGKDPSESTRNPARSAAVSGGLSNSAVSKNKVRILKMLAIVALLFALSWLPYFTVLIIAVRYFTSVVRCCRCERQKKSFSAVFGKRWKEIMLFLEKLDFFLILSFSRKKKVFSAVHTCTWRYANFDVSFL